MVHIWGRQGLIGTHIGETGAIVGTRGIAETVDLYGLNSAASVFYLWEINLKTAFILMRI